MTPGARIQAAIEILDAIAAASRAPADAVVSGYVRGRRYIGSGDRAEIGRLVYGVLRVRAQLDWSIARAGAPAAPDGRARVIAHLALADGWKPEHIEAACDGDRYRPATLSRGERTMLAALAGRRLDDRTQPDWVRWNLPEWLYPAFAERFGTELALELRAMGEEAPLDLRVNLLKATREKAEGMLRKAGLRSRPTPLSPLGLRLPARAPLGGVAPYDDGLVEVQDEGSQIAALLVAAKPGMRVVDFCAGAGGKTLAMAAGMANKGHIVACDVVEKRLAGATKRLRRGGVFNVEPRLMSGERDPWVKRHAQGFDRVLVDAPCSGTGTWRRNPDARWGLAPADLDRLVELQAKILDSAARLAKPGGRLVYVTCSLLKRENEDQVDAFLARNPAFMLLPIGQVWPEAIGTAPPAPGPHLQLTPARHGTDGFFVAVLERR